MAIKSKRYKTKKKNKIANLFIKQGRLRWFNTLGFATLLFMLALFVSQIYTTKSTDKLTQKNEMTQVQSRTAWLKKIAPYAQRLQKKYGVLASITLAQAAHESNWNDSQLSSKYYNFYGIKASSGQAAIKLPTSEYIDGKWITVNARFRVYTSWQASMLDHTLLLVNGTTENPNRYYRVLHARNYKIAAKALYQAGYATDPTYATKLIKIIEQYHLDRYDY
ncbi:flagellum-specific peptidoglycan hydrolase FlgJ [Weissella beninensis]|uniref:Glycoside hydrolase family 73 protein n=1 Tax=Periweissella beninensis TaxID=504936 RepID=A0ABT0VKD7_9LACO|nr:glycoside hydrolase family 73 protein [Periweissella beninensis]MBM7544600.1 flagellum-specific peptidoglycan hydrolase FlgJ [Periweissella beninensis]MCM2436867.1 glycoside hydrolase family 73 protein [Periweissella beninensis]